MGKPVHMINCTFRNNISLSSFCVLKTKKSGFRTADRPPESPKLPVFPVFLPKMRKETPFIVVDKKRFFYVKDRHNDT